MVACLALALSLQSPSLSVVVDAREVTRGLFHVTEHMRAKPGPLVLWFPRWIPGWHSPGGPINNLLSFRIAADGKTLAWSRDLVDMFQVTAEVPQEAKELTIEFTQADSSGSAHLARVDWNELVWYPASPSDEVMCSAELILPTDWKAATALPIKSETGSRVVFQPASLTRLVDSPAEIGRYFKRYDVTGHSRTKHFLDVMADTSDGIDAPQEVLDAVRRTHEEMEAITGSNHYREYHWLLTLSDNGAGAGLEHHESSEDGTGSDGFTGGRIDMADLLCHEYFHSYNGKFRRPVGLCTPDYQKPMKDDLLWVYEGLTQFMGHILDCRAGWWSQEQWREQMALNYVSMNTHRGREWRPLVDTAAGVPSSSFSRGPSWTSAHRASDYYVEMTIVWLEVDMRIRELTGGKKSLMDFLRVFHGGPSNGPELKPYTFEDVVAALNQVAPYDWAALLRERVYSVQPELSLKGFELAGWKLVYNDEPNVMMGKIYGTRGGQYLATSIGLMISPDGTIQDVVPGSPADKFGLAPDMKVLAVGSDKYGEAVMARAVKRGGTIPMTVSYKDQVRTINLEYGGGMRIPHLVRMTGTTDRFPDLLTPLAK